MEICFINRSTNGQGLDRIKMFQHHRQATGSQDHIRKQQGPQICGEDSTLLNTELLFPPIPVVLSWFSGSMHTGHLKKTRGSWNAYKCSLASVTGLSTSFSQMNWVLLPCNLLLLPLVGFFLWRATWRVPFLIMRLKECNRGNVIACKLSFI